MKSDGTLTIGEGEHIIDGEYEVVKEDAQYKQMIVHISESTYLLEFDDIYLEADNIAV